jgi:ABC-type transporter Mla subunit MlaD
MAQSNDRGVSVGLMVGILLVVVLIVAIIAAYLGGKDANVNIELSKPPATTGEN